MTPFTVAVTKVVKGIRSGQVMTYQAVATEAGYPGAARAVANLMVQNFDPTIPCHRVVRADGTPGGYNRGGPEEKSRLLQLEGVTL